MPNPVKVLQYYHNGTWLVWTLGAGAYGENLVDIPCTEFYISMSLGFGFRILDVLIMAQEVQGPTISGNFT
jgi:hypothetical protein